MSVTNGVSGQSVLSNVATVQPPQHVIGLKQISISPGSPPWSETIVITPDLAESWLSANVLNRKHRRSRVRTYARDMAAGRWMFNTQGITFATDGTLIDGQHRLMAVVESGVSVQMVVWFNVPPKTRDVIDLVGPRNLCDIARLNFLQAAISTTMMRGLGRSNAATGATMAERAAFYRRFASEIDGVIARFPTHQRGIKQAAVLAAICRASMHMSSDDIDRFCDVLKSGLSADPRDTTVIRLRDRLLSSARHGGTAQKEVYALTTTALRAFGRGQSLSKIYAATSEAFPLPDRFGE